MDIQHLLDRLETLLSDSRRIGGKLIVDAQRSWDLIDQMRISVPEEVKQAQRVNQERDRIIAQAKEEAGRIVDLARQEAVQLTGEHLIAQQAQELAATIEARARRDARNVQQEADEYVMEVLTQLDADLVQGRDQTYNSRVHSRACSSGLRWLLKWQKMSLELTIPTNFPSSTTGI